VESTGVVQATFRGIGVVSYDHVMRPIGFRVGSDGPKSSGGTRFRVDILENVVGRLPKNYHPAPAVVLHDLDRPFPLPSPPISSVRRALRLNSDTKQSAGAIQENVFRWRVGP
jgi:hypothetical protein